MDATSSSGAVMVGNVLVPYTEVKAMAMFRVSEQEMESFKLGVERIRLYTLPITHDRTFNNDKIGMPLYQNYRSEKKKAKIFKFSFQWQKGYIYKYTFPDGKVYIGQDTPTNQRTSS